MFNLIEKLISYFKFEYYKKYNIIGSKRLDPRNDILGVSNYKFFLKPGFTEQDYYKIPDNERNYLLDLSEKRWLAWCKREDYFLQNWIPLKKI